MRLGGPVALPESGDPGEWIARHKELGYGAAIFPLNHTAAADVVRAITYRGRAMPGIVIGEVGAWSNPISDDDEERRRPSPIARPNSPWPTRSAPAAASTSPGRGARSGTAPHPDNLTTDTFALIVDTTREIIDAVKPTRTFYTLEAMPWIFPDSPRIVPAT